MDRYQPDPRPAVATPLDIAAVDGEVVFLGPGPIAFAMTAEAAAETARRLARVLADQAGTGG